MGYRTYNIKRTSIKKKNALPFILLAAGAAAAVVVLCLFFCTNIFTDKNVTLIKTDTLVHETVAGCDSGIVSLSQEKITYMDFDGSVVWEAAVDASYNKLSVSDTVIGTYNETGAVFYDHSATPLFIVDMESPVSKVACGSDIVGVMTVQKAEADSSSYFHIYDLKGNGLSTIEFASKQVLDAGIYGSSDMIYALTLDTSGVVPICYITTYKSDGTITGSISVNTQLLDNVTITDTEIFASGTNSLTKYSYFGETGGELLIYGWKPYDEFVSGTDALFLYTTREAQTLDDSAVYSVKVIDETLSEIMIYFPEALNYVCCSTGKVYAFGEYSIYVYDETGELTSTISSETPITNAKKLDNGYAVVWDNASSYILKIS